MRLRILLLFCLVFPLLTGWGHWGPQVKIGFAVDNAQERRALVKNLKDELEENRADLLLTDAKGDPALQVEQVKDLIAKGIQALIVLPVDPQKAAPLVEAAHQAEIKVISLDRLIPGGGLDYLIAFNDEKAGELQAKAIVKRMAKGQYVLLGPNGKFRDGEMKVLQPLIDRGDIQIAASRAFEGTETPKKVSDEMKAILKAEKNKVDAVLPSDNAATEGIAEALGRMELSTKLVLAGTGEDLGTCQRILSGVQALTVYHPPKKMAAEAAYLTAKVARKATQFDCQFTDVDNGGGTTKAVLLTPVVVDAKNLDSTIIADGVQKKEEVYGTSGR